MTLRFLTGALAFATGLCFSNVSLADVYDVTLKDYPRLAGETNDTDRVLRAVAAATPGDVLYFPKGLYEISKTIEVTNGVSVLLHKSATLKAVAKMENLLVLDRLSTWAQGGKEGITYDQGLFLRGGHLDGNGLATCLYLNRYFHFTVRDVVFANGYPYGLHVGKTGAEVVANNLYFRTYRKGLAGNVALFSEGNDSYYTDIVVVDYTVGLRTTGGANAFTHYHVWGGFVPPVAKGRLPEMLENSICFDLGGHMNMLRDSYADTGAVGFRLGGWGHQVVGCWFLNNARFGLKDITVVKQTPGSYDMLVADCCFRGSGPQTKLYEGPGTLKWRDMLYRGFRESTELPAELEAWPVSTCATPDEWEFVREPVRFESPAGEFKAAKSARWLEVTALGHAVRRRFPDVGPGREVVFRIRATDEATRKVEFSLAEENGRIWGKIVEIGPDWREVRLRLDELRYFSSWGLPPIPEGAKPDARRMTLARFMYGNWLTEGTSEKTHGFEVSSLKIIWGE